MVLAATGLLADAAAVAGLFAESPRALVLIAAVLALVLGGWLGVRLWGRPFGFTAVLTLFSVLAGIVLIAVAAALPAEDAVAEDSGGGTTTKQNRTTDPDAPESVTTTKPPTAGHQPKALEVKLDYGVGADVDGAKPTLTRTQRPTGDIDISMTDIGLIYTTGDGFVAYNGKLSDAESTCANALTDEVTKWERELLAVPGTRYCFATSQGRTGLLEITGAPGAGGAQLELAIRVW
ncbi:hypothetical protein CLV40_102228 [Actinokineospora auranticolor]|uniref:Uncharacterized protein n=1 Tax=Actinokineospora auranticolor TaxID=155976 RepID=A0A2S6GYS2_9PSEU|nr:hypothetical protein CLV40_102228 [Actinokineospora auranticolor]